MYDMKLAEQLLAEVPYRMAAFEEFDSLDYPIWKRIKGHDNEPTAYRSYNNLKIMCHREEGLSVTPEVLVTEEEMALADRMDYGPSKKHRRLVEAFANSGSRIEVANGHDIQAPVVVQMTLNKDNPLLLDHHMLKVGKNSTVTVIYDYSNLEGSVYNAGLIQVMAEAGAKVHVVKIQNLIGESTHIHGGLAVIGRDAEVTYNSIDLGEGLIVSDFSAYLEEENSRIKTESIYLGESDTRLDLSFNTYHKGRRSVSDIIVNGALLDSARKVFRGNLYFAKGAKRAQGAEKEYVILLDDHVKADAIPALMCDEDDVQGEHAASAGQVDQQKLFYLMSRGLTEREAKQLIIMAAFAPVIEQLPVEGLKERIHDTVGEKLSKDLK